MSNAERLSDWLNKTFNDLYTVYSEYDCELHTVEYSTNANVQQFIRFLKSEYPKLDFENTDVIYSAGTFSLLCEPYGSIDIETFDDKLYHIELIQLGG